MCNNNNNGRVKPRGENKDPKPLVLPVLPIKLAPPGKKSAHSGCKCGTECGCKSEGSNCGCR